MGPRGWL